ncbi:hypothetical protein AG1IA_09150 [Rhizoctonia solani AG-1 IA]|uniref:Uncharacterized protein n=1 Tax=Thanatephorus cucumeris (strain AG1-IA) TaxID=983506 RepID=L8WFV3_THACA|nr:hypothetical protein AG1IA_09150 [Rhizoctonia solani AG-1 IA]
MSNQKSHSMPLGRCWRMPWPKRWKISYP